MNTGPTSRPRGRADKPQLSVRSFGLTDSGRRRPTNEDQFLIAELTKAMAVAQTSLPGPSSVFGEERGHLFLVADGVGGHNAGERASALAVAAIEQFTVNTFKWFLQRGEQRAWTAATEFETAIREADATIIREAQDHPEFRGMGTTLTLAYAVANELFVLHVGDSRAYIFREGSLTQLTRDHTVVADLVQRGHIHAEEAHQHHLRHVVTNVLGGPEIGVRADAHMVDLRRRDGLLLCSDGLTEMVSADDIAAILTSAAEPEDACKQLVALANERGGHDNITVIVAQFL